MVPVRRLTPMTATDLGCMTRRIERDSARCSRLIRTAREASVGSMSKDTAMTPSSNSWATS